MKRYQMPLINREMQIRTTKKCHFTPVRIAVVKKNTNNKRWWGCRIKKLLYTVGGNVNLYSHCEKQYENFSKKLKVELLYEPAIPLLGINLEKKKLIWKDIYTPVFIEALFTISKMWKQPKWASTDEWIKMWCVYPVKYYSAIKKNGILHMQQHEETWRGVVLSEISQRTANTVWYHLYVESKRQ